ncbi:MAG: RNA methyltransferase [Anaeromicrobium sp.]|uniref:TrmH family RNA methyltransferase n=1 Tax=Anaeromicrobium sp. TaxID=1929132 RepID=UPI0025CEEF0B|nr:RNA methyltransferase [Anaeromicrobium sp.]MCT4594100.1 RNA methyltransferase [Anaeromicrobium sp.]
MVIKITSSDNKIVKNTRQLNKRKSREKNKEYIIEGVRSVRDAIKYEEEIKYILYSNKINNVQQGEGLLEDVLSLGLKVYEVDEKIFNSLSDTENSQGIMAVIGMKKFDINEIIRPNGLYVVLDRIQDPGNLGTIIRTADSAGFHGVILTKGCVDIYNPKAIRSTMGSIFNIPIIQGFGEEDLIEVLHREKINIVCTSLDTDKYYYDVDFSKNVAIVIGNEGNGVSDYILNKSNLLIKIPILGKAESLNASTASSVIIYESVRQRMTKLL